MCDEGHTHPHPPTPPPTVHCVVSLLQLKCGQVMSSEATPTLTQRSGLFEALGLERHRCVCVALILGCICVDKSNFLIF